MADTFVGRQLMHARVDFVERHTDGPLVDIGIGSGAFIIARNRFYGRDTATAGYDVNPVAREWLSNAGLLSDVESHRPYAISLWDVLEHIPDFTPLLDRVQQYVFVSIPIFDNAEHVLRSKHFRKDEHCWYFTKGGLIQAMGYHGFELDEFNRDEETLGREDIGSFAFRRVRERQLT